jgi:hypothetical protein
VSEARAPARPRTVARRAPVSGAQRRGKLQAGCGGERRGELLQVGRSGDTRAVRSAEISAREEAGYAIGKNTKLI